MEVNLREAKEMISKLLKANLVPLMAGDPGLGKSAIVKQIAQEYNLELIDIRLSQMEPIDLVGFPMLEGPKATFKPMDTFPIETDPVPEGKAGWLIFMDELTSAMPAVQVAAYRLILDREVGQHKLHPKVRIVGAGNLETSGAVVQPLSTALQSRLVHLTVRPDLKVWQEDFAEPAGVNPWIISYLNFKPDQLYTFKADHTDNTYACPRTWSFANSILEQFEGHDDKLLFPTLGGALSFGVASDFLAFCRIKLPTYAQIIKDPEGITMTDEPSVLYALTGMVPQHIKEKDLEKAMKFITRMPIEFQIIMVKNLRSKINNLINHPVMADWLDKTAGEIAK